jgi:hypothetical protein
MWLLILATPLIIYGTMCYGIYSVLKSRRDRGISPRCSQTDLKLKY